MTRTIMLSTLFLASVAALPTAAQAQDANSMRVSYVDLNLASSPGQANLQRRIADAARTVCGIEDSRELALWFSAHDCRRDAVERARPAYEAAVASYRRGIVSVVDSAALVVTDR